DKYRGRVIYPIFSISGKVLGFGGRTLRNDKDVAKYINSPENAIYHKSNTLYGLYQAKQAIAKADRCILVEGYMDVISMSQSGVENVVASSGTSLTESQIKLIHRFTPNVTLIYDSDPAGIKASLRGINMLLAEGMDVKVVLLPDGDDPDSFAQSHSTTEIEQYLNEHATDFISFKTKILLQGVQNDPIARSKVITDIVESISVIPDLIKRTVYTRECSLSMGIDERVLTQQVEKFYRIRRDKEAVQAAKDKAAATLNTLHTASTHTASTANINTIPADNDAMLRRYERRLLRYVLKYGLLELCMSWSSDGEQQTPMRLIDYVEEELATDNIELRTPVYARAYELAKRLREETYEDDEQQAINNAMAERQRMWDEGVEEIRRQGIDLADIKAKEVALTQQCDDFYNDRITQFKANYIASRLMSSEDDEIRILTADLVSDKYT
ncbi:MAG: toprim domain-containing protein, partial [Muribaculaceae bacterium]|nr:toprim domain-containing protein [Muribaculaceae bacterium]